MTDITGTDKLVSNLYIGTLTKVANYVGSNRQYASSFTAGHNPGGYKLDRIRTHIPDDHSSPVLALHTDTSFAPGAKLCDFRNPTQVQHLVYWEDFPAPIPFTAPDCSGRNTGRQRQILDSLRRNRLQTSGNRLRRGIDQGGRLVYRQHSAHQDHRHLGRPQQAASLRPKSGHPHARQGAYKPTQGSPTLRVEESVHDEFKNLSVALPYQTRPSVSTPLRRRQVQNALRQTIA